MKRLLSLSIALLLLLVQSKMMPAALADGAPGVLVINNSDVGTRDAASWVLRQVLYAGSDCDCINAKSYTQGLLKRYGSVVVLENGGGLGRALLSDLSDFTGKLLWFGPGLQQYLDAAGISANVFQVKTDAAGFSFDGKQQKIALGSPETIVQYQLDGQTFVPFGACPGSSGAWSFFAGKLSYFGLFSEISDNYRIQTAAEYMLAAYLNLGKVTPGVYINIDYIYPVSEYNAICDMAQYLQQEKLPFTFTVMPFYNAADAASSDEYGRMLKYLERCGGYPVIHVPVFNPMSAGDTPIFSDMYGYLKSALANYTKLGIYPMAIEMPENYLLRTDFTNFFQNFSDYFAVRGDGKEVYTVGDQTQDAGLEDQLTHYHGVRHAVQELRFAQDRTDELYAQMELASQNPYFNYRVSITSDTEFSQYREFINGIKNHNIQLADLALTEHTVNYDDIKLKFTGGTIISNGSVMKPDLVGGEPSLTPGLNNGSTHPIEDMLHQGNSLIVVFSSVSIVVLTAAFFVSRKKNRDKHLRR